MAEPIELKIGQVWESLCRGRETGARYRVKLIAIGPDFVAVQVVSGAWPHFESVRLWHVDQLRGEHALIRPKHELWVNVYRYESGYMAGAGHATEADAKKGAAYADGKGAEYRIACLKIEFEEGDGL